MHNVLICMLPDDDPTLRSLSVSSFLGLPFQVLVVVVVAALLLLLGPRRLFALNKSDSKVCTIYAPSMIAKYKGHSQLLSLFQVMLIYDSLYCLYVYLDFIVAKKEHKKPLSCKDKTKNTKNKKQKTKNHEI